MRTSDRSNVAVAHASRLRSRELKMESSCRGAETRRSSRFCAVRLAMPLARLSDRIAAQNAQRLFRVEFSGAQAGGCRVQSAAWATVETHFLYPEKRRLV